MFILLLLLTQFTYAENVTVAVIDTGFDLDHDALRPKLNSGETDEEVAVAMPGFTGWDFDDNTHLKSSVLKPGELQEVLYYRGLRAKSHQQGLSPEERQWIDVKMSNPHFKKQLKLFKKHTHGTMVAGIIVNQGEGIDVFPVRGLGIDVPTVVVETPSENAPPIRRFSETEFRRQVKLSEDRIIRKMRKMLSWINLRKIRVVNASYGVTQKQILSRFAEWHKEITGLDLDPIKVKEIADEYFASLYKRADKILANYPNTLFIFSAGNSGQNNDENHHFPSKIRRDHCISVAALHGEELAKFSNWGKLHVDIAAPGVGIMSVVPTVYAQASGLKKTPASGTSMAAPAISNLAARCLQLNGKLQASEVKTILLETGNRLEKLKSKIVSESSVNPEKTLKACELSNEMPLEKSIELAQSDVVKVEENSP